MNVYTIISVTYIQLIQPLSKWLNIGGGVGLKFYRNKYCDKIMIYN